MFALGAAPAKIVAGRGTLYLGAWPNRIFVIDEAAEKVVSTIETAIGVPRTMSLSRDGRRLYVTNASEQDLEIIDVATRKSIQRVAFNEGRRTAFVTSVVADPLNRFVVLVLRITEKLVDRYNVLPTRIAVFNLSEGKFTHTIPWPHNDPRLTASMLISPDGKLLYLLSDDGVAIYETTSFTQVDAWDLALSPEEGLGRFDFGPRDSTYEEPGYYSGIFFVKGPMQSRRVMVVARVNLNAKSMEFWPIGPAKRVSFALAPDRKHAYGLVEEIGHYEFWTFDLEHHRLGSRSEFDGRPRMALRTSSNGKVLYIFEAGNTIDLYQADDYKYLRTIELPGDMTTDLIVSPEPPRILSPSQH
jgi:YVTN family beta-propeller protein